MKRDGDLDGLPLDAGFRLLTEPASLKPAPGRLQNVQVEGFPAPHRAGLIEATVTDPSPPIFRGSFRLLTEPASLKRLAPRFDGCRTVRSFRLLTEPASLKRPGRRRAARAAGEFPAPHRAGLIEAISGSVGVRDDGGVSGSSQSRPH